MTVELSGSVAARVGARLDRLPITRWQVLVRVAIGVVTFFDAFDQLLISYVLPVISQEWRLSPAGSTWAITAGSLGMLGGALLSGRLADRYGRVRLITVALLVYSLASLALAASPGFLAFLLLRFVQGLGIGGEVPIAATYIGEIANVHRRGRFVLLYEIIFPVGLLAASLVAIWVIPAFGWRWMFVLGALPLPAVYLIRRYVPESPRWLAARGQGERALAVLGDIERKVAAYTGRPLPEPAPVPPVAAATQPTVGAWRELFTGRYRRRTLTLWGLWFCSYFVVYGIASWLPTIYRTVFHLSLREALAYSMLGILATVVGSLLIARTTCRWGAAAGGVGHGRARRGADRAVELGGRHLRRRREHRPVPLHPGAVPDPDPRPGLQPGRGMEPARGDRRPGGHRGRLRRGPPEHRVRGARLRVTGRRTGGRPGRGRDDPAAPRSHIALVISEKDNSEPSHKHKLALC
jgi:putative MFS transporter